MVGYSKRKPASVSEHVIGGVEYMSPRNIFYRIELYQKTFENLLTLKQDNANEYEGTSQDSTINEFWDTRGNSNGIELLVKKSSENSMAGLGIRFQKLNITRSQVDGIIQILIELTPLILSGIMI